MAVRWASNHAPVADRAFVPARVSGGRLLLQPSLAEDRWVEIVLDGQPAEPEPPDPELPRPGTMATAHLDADMPPLARRAIETHQAMMEGMTLEEQRDYLWDVVRVIEAAHFARVGKLIDAAGRDENGKLRLTAHRARLLLILWDARGRTLTHEYIGQRMEQETGVWTDPLAIAQIVKHLRKALAELGWPLTIRSVYGIGYALISDDMMQAPWDARQFLTLQVTPQADPTPDVSVDNGGAT